MLARAPNAVCARVGDASVTAPLDVATPERSDGSGGTVRGRSYILSVVDVDLVAATVGSLVSCTDRDAVSTQYRVHDRQPSQGDGLVHELLLVEVS